MTTNRIYHTACDHAKTAAGRKMCRAGDAILRTAGTHDHLVMNGVTYLVLRVVALYTTPAEVRVATYTRGIGWVELDGWVSAVFFAKAKKI